ncbi:MAG TPA: AAA family ATPase [Acidobacteriaceae bacterium]|nr:AAA family ATPase [Acidobacteriaceae bacterium]
MQAFGDFQLDPVNECVWRHGECLSLTPRPYAVLRYLVENSQRLVTHDELLEALWPETYVQPQILRTYVLELRKLLGDDPASPQYIATIPKRGYRFVAEVTQVSNGSSEEHLLVGRDAELAFLYTQLERARKAERPTVFLTGEAGIGKTALIDAFCKQICESKSAVRIARGQSIEGFSGKETLYPVREALNGLCSDEDAKARALLCAAAPGWFNHDNSAIPSLGEICEALEALSQTEPLLLVFEDIHWADATTLDLIAALARRRTPAKIMLLASVCPADLEPKSPLRRLQQDLARGRRVEEFELGPLNRTAVCEYIRCKLHAHKLPAGFDSLILQHSSGNPLFLSAMLDHLRAQHVLRSQGDEVLLNQPLAEIELGVPDGLLGIIELQLDQLSEEDRRLLEAGSIAGTIFPAWAASAVLKRPLEDVEEAYASLVRRIHLVSVGGHDELPNGTRSTFYVFAHELYREVLYKNIPVTRRSQWHKQVAGQLRVLFAGNEASVAHEIAAHTEASTSPR